MNVRPFEVLLVEDNPGDVLLTTEALEEAKLHLTLSVVSDGVQDLGHLVHLVFGLFPRHGTSHLLRCHTVGIFHESTVSIPPARRLVERSPGRSR